MSSTRVMLAAAAAVAALGFDGAAAAPQVLGIVASNGTIPLHCDAQGCRADLSTFCLQQPRANPEPGQRYDLADASSLTLVGTTAQGETVRLPAAGHVRIASERGFTSVEMTMPAELLDSLGLVTVAVEVAPNASLIPAAAAGDPDPQSREEVDLAVDVFRRAGARFFDESGESGDAIRLTNLMINDLPKGRRAQSDTDSHLVDSALGSTAAKVADPTGIDLARAHHDSCVGKVDVSHHVDSMRSCLQGTHDRLVANTNVDFWRSLDGY